MLQRWSSAEETWSSSESKKVSCDIVGRRPAFRRQKVLYRSVGCFVSRKGISCPKSLSSWALCWLDVAVGALIGGLETLSDRGCVHKSFLYQARDMTGRMPQTLLWLWVPSFVPCGTRGQTDRQDRQTSGCYLFPLRDSDELVGLCIWSTELRNSGIFLACPLSEIAVWPSEFVFFGIKLLWVEIQDLFWRWLPILIGLASLTCLFPWIFWSTWLRTRNPESLLMSLHNFFCFVSGSFLGNGNSYGHIPSGLWVPSCLLITSWPIPCLQRSEMIQVIDVCSLVIGADHQCCCDGIWLLCMHVGASASGTQNTTEFRLLVSLWMMISWSDLCFCRITGRLKGFLLMDEWIFWYSSEQSLV